MKDKRGTETHTAQGFLKAKYLTDEMVEAIFVKMEEGMREGSACRTQGTSYTQLIRRVRHDPVLTERMREAERLQRQHKTLQSNGAVRSEWNPNKNVAGIHEKPLSD